MDLDLFLPAIQAGDDDAFARWMRHAEPTVRAGLRRFAAQVDTEAVVQEALLRAWQFAPRVHPDGAGNSLLRYACRTATHLAIDAIRRTRRAPVVELDDLDAREDAPLTPEALGDPRLRDQVRRCVEALPGRPRAALEARLGVDSPRHDRTLAEGLGMTLNTFLQNVTRARKALLDCLARVGITGVGGAT